MLRSAKKADQQTSERERISENTDGHFNLLPLNSENAFLVCLIAVCGPVYTRRSFGTLKGGSWPLKVFQHCKRATMGLYSFSVGTGLRNSNVAQRVAWSLALISSDDAAL